MPNAGDQVTVLLAVTPADATTAATLTITAPDGTLSTPVTTSVDDGATWTAPVIYTAAGVWRLTWTVTGTGASIEYELVSVAPAPGGPVDGRAYATTTQLADYLQAAPALDSARLLLRASELLDADFLLPAVYEVDADGMPTDPDVIKGFANAVCAQVEFWGEAGEETDISGPLVGAQIGSVNLQFGAGANRTGSSYYAPKLLRALASIPKDVFRMQVTAEG